MDKFVKSYKASNEDKIHLDDIDSKKRYKANSFEIIVIILIISILAAVCIPLVLQFVDESKLQQANANAKTIYNAAVPVEAGLTDTVVKPEDFKALAKWTNINDSDNTFVAAMYKYLNLEKLSGYFKFNFKGAYMESVDFIMENNTKFMGSSPAKNKNVLEEEVNIEAQNLRLGNEN